MPLETLAHSPELVVLSNSTASHVLSRRELCPVRVNKVSVIGILIVMMFAVSAYT